MHARSLGNLASNARGVFPLDMIPLVLPVAPGRKLDQHQAHILDPVGVAGSDQIKSSDGPP